MLKRLCLVLLAFSLSLLAQDPFKNGDQIPAFDCKDQHEKEYHYTPGSVRILAVSYEMGVGKATNAWLAKQASDFLETRKSVFLADIHPMPGIGRMFALPKMRKYPHRIILGDDEELLKRHPRKKGHLTVFVFDASGKIEAIRYVDPEKDPEAAFRP